MAPLLAAILPILMDKLFNRKKTVDTGNQAISNKQPTSGTGLNMKNTTLGSSMGTLPTYNKQTPL